MTKLTVVIPTRNEKPENLLRAVSFKHPQIEYLVWFDNDEDEEEFGETWDWAIRELDSQKDVYVEHSKIGLINIQNKGLEWGKEYFAYLHGHDKLNSGVVDLIEFLDANPDYAVVYGTQQYAGLFTHKAYPQNCEPDRIYDYDFFRNAVVYRSSALKEIGGFRAIYGDTLKGHNEEYDVNLRLIEAGYKYKAVLTKEPALHFTIHRHGLTEEIARNIEFVNAKFREVHPKWRGRTMVTPSDILGDDDE